MKKTIIAVATLLPPLSLKQPIQRGPVKVGLLLLQVRLVGKDLLQISLFLMALPARIKMTMSGQTPNSLFRVLREIAKKAPLLAELLNSFLRTPQPMMPTMLLG